MWPQIFFSVPSDILQTARSIRKCIIPLNDEWVDIELAQIIQLLNSLAYYRPANAFFVLIGGAKRLLFTHHTQPTGLFEGRCDDFYTPDNVKLDSQDRATWNNSIW